MPFDEAAHPRAAEGASGGEFVAADQGPTGKSVLGLKAKNAVLPKAKAGGKGKGKKGGGKGAKKPAGKGDEAKTKAQTTALQKALAAAGFKGADGKPLAATGKPGPETTAAIKAAQRKYGMKPDGKPTPALLRRLSKPRMAKTQLTAKSPLRKPAPKPTATPKPRPAPTPGRPPSLRDSAPDSVSRR